MINVQQCIHAAEESVMRAQISYIASPVYQTMRNVAERFGIEDTVAGSMGEWASRWPVVAQGILCERLAVLTEQHAKMPQREIAHPQTSSRRVRECIASAEDAIRRSGVMFVQSPIDRHMHEISDMFGLAQPRCGTSGDWAAEWPSGAQALLCARLASLGPMLSRMSQGHPGARAVTVGAGAPAAGPGIVRDGSACVRAAVAAAAERAAENPPSPDVAALVGPHGEYMVLDAVAANAPPGSTQPTLPGATVDWNIVTTWVATWPAASQRALCADLSRMFPVPPPVNAIEGKWLVAGTIAGLAALGLAVYQVNKDRS